MSYSRLQSLLTILAFVISGLTILYTLTGFWLFLEYLVVSGIALLGWLRSPVKKEETTDQVVPFYILAVVLFLIVLTCRYWSDVPQFLRIRDSSFFKPGFQLQDTNWLIFFVSLPVSLLLLGGYFLTRRTPAGSYFAWWGFSFCILETLLQFKMELGSPGTYKHGYFLGALAAMALFVLSVRGILLLIRPAVKDEGTSVGSSTLTNKQVNLWTAFFISCITVYGITVYVEAGLLPVGIIVGSMMGGIMGWRKTTARLPGDPYTLTPLYLLLLALFYFHVGEENLTHFSQAIAGLTGTPWKEQNFNFLIVFWGPTLWVFAAYSLWKGGALGNFILWFMIVGMILGEPTHFLVFPVVRLIKEGGSYQYFSGMYTALFPMIPAVLALVHIMRDYKVKTKVLGHV